MSAFNELWDASKKGKLLLVDGGMCLFNRRKRDDVIVIYAILVLPERQKRGIGDRMLVQLEAMKPAAKPTRPESGTKGDK